MPRIITESLALEQRLENLPLNEWDALGCLYATQINILHPDGTQEEVTRLYAFKGLTNGTAGERIYKELSPHATLKVLRGECCACEAHRSDKRVRVCKTRPTGGVPVPNKDVV